MYLIFDVETSGFLQPNYTNESGKNGRIMQLAALLLDEHFVEKGIFSSLIRIPENTQIHEKAFEKHKISMEDCRKFGVPIELALCQIEAFEKQSKYQIAHNANFDVNFINNEDAAAFGESRFKFPGVYCTMELMTPVCQLKFPSGKQGNKWPSLEEAYNHLFGANTAQVIQFHNALDDVRATAKIFKYLVKEGYIIS